MDVDMFTRLTDGTLMFSCLYQYQSPRIQCDDDIHVLFCAFICE